MLKYQRTNLDSCWGDRRQRLFIYFVNL